MEHYEIAAPDARGTVASLRSLGYTVAAAVADLIDNSVAAHATSIDVICTWAGQDSWIAVADNGDGMDEVQLRKAMTVAGNAANLRTSTDLGRFGMGLKTASFSQASELTVSTTQTGSTNNYVRRWDLDVVQRTGEWRLLTQVDDATQVILQRLGQQRGGTVVLWRRLRRFDNVHTEEHDERAQTLFYDEVRDVRRWLGMVFGLFLAGRAALRLSVNGERVQPWDPFATDEAATQHLPTEELPVGRHIVRVEPYVLPHRALFASATAHETAAGPSGWADQQGFYIYRRRRLLVAGSWLGIRGLRREEKFALARIAVHIPVELDAAWAVDVRKATVVPPTAARAALRRIGLATQRAAREVVTRRSRVAARSYGRSDLFVWRLVEQAGGVTCRINRDHPLVAEALRGGPDAARNARALVRLIEETVPADELRILRNSDTSRERAPFDGVADDAAQEVARCILAALVAGGATPREARQRLAQTEPFDRLDGFWHTAPDT